MNELICNIRTKLTGIIAILIVLMLSDCTIPLGEGFAIYLTKGDIPPAQLASLSHVDTAEEPVISMKDIVTYNAQTYELKLTKSAYERICKLDVPVRGRSFVVCVDGNPIYCGAFWTPISSMSFDGVTIWKPLIVREPYIIKLQLGYPSSSFYGGKDPRSSPEIIRSLEQAGKLIKGLSIKEVNVFPHSMKGYELYSWLEDNQWHFTLITGTNRNKTMEEIISREDFVSESGWVRIHMVGVDALKAALNKFPQQEDIVWLAQPRLEQTQQGNINFTLPPQADVDSIKEHSKKCCLNLMVAS